MSERSIIDAIKHEAVAVTPDDTYDALLSEIGDTPTVLLGEATHGSDEFYRARSVISQRLITEKGFDAIAVEADWPDAMQVNRFVLSETVPAAPGAAHSEAQAGLEGFTRFPLWMWRNTQVVNMIDWLRSWNRSHASAAAPVGFYGLDLYSLRKSMQAVVQYLQQVDPEAAKQARKRYGCFDHLAEDPQSYGYAANFGMKKDCEEEVVRQLVALTFDVPHYLTDGPTNADELFYAQQNARVAQNAEAYYRTTHTGGESSWNLRDTHMADTLDALREHLQRHRGRPAQLIVWAHNSHIGDARATQMGDHGQLNLGQLVRQRYPSDQSYLVGFTTHVGTVTAASEWDGPAMRKAVLPSRTRSFERLFHDVGIGNFLLPIRGRHKVETLLRERRLERAIGVLYLPASERRSHYFEAAMGQQFDAVIHFDETSALHPLDQTTHWKHDEAPETYPSGI